MHLGDEMKKIFIDGSAGTTGLKIVQRLKGRDDIELITLTQENRKDTDARKQAINSSDITFLCLPDVAAVESVGLVENENTAVIDTSTAHRVNPEWDYGFPELTGKREKITSSKRVANPGCHATGFIALVAPLIENGIVSKDALLTCCSLTGYSGGGKKMIADYENEERSELLDSPAMYGLTQKHKHLPEMSKICGLNNLPIFCPVVAPYFSGMEVTVPLFASQIKGNIKDIKEIYKEYYSSKIVKYIEHEESFIYSNKLSGYDEMHITVKGNEERILLVSTFDNLGKGASGAAIQNMNILLGVPQEKGLNLL